MAATPKNATLTFKGLQSGRVFTYNVYDSDVANAFATWSTVGAAGTGSTNFIIAPENMQLIDASVPTGLADTTNLLFYINDAPAPNTIFPVAQIVNTLPTRSFPPVAISAGRKVQLIQLA